MASPVTLYQTEMHNNTGFFATWLPGDLVEIGDVGLLKRGRFRRMSSLRELGIKFTVTRAGSSQNVDYSSTQATKVGTGMSADPAALGNAEIQIDFSRKGAFLFQASKLQQWELENRMGVAEEILKAFNQKKWKPEWLLIESLHVADIATIIVSEENSAELVLAAEINEAVPSVSLVDPKVSLSVKSSRGKIIRCIGSEHLHPLYSCLRVKNPLFGSASVQPVRGVKPVDIDGLFSRPGINDLLDS